MFTPNDIIISASHIECNKHCADCGRSTAIAGCNADIRHGIFICINCAKIHRELGYLIKSLNEKFTAEETIPFQCHTNNAFNKIWMAKWSESDIPLPQIADDTTRRKFIIQKYIDKLWYSENIQQKNFTKQQQRSNPRDIFSNYDPLKHKSTVPQQTTDSLNSNQTTQAKYIYPQQVNGNQQYNSQGQIYSPQYYSNNPYDTNPVNCQNIQQKLIHQQQNVFQQQQEIMRQQQQQEIMFPQQQQQEIMFPQQQQEIMRQQQQQEIMRQQLQQEIMRQQLQQQELMRQQQQQELMHQQLQQQELMRHHQQLQQQELMHHHHHHQQQQQELMHQQLQQQEIMHQQHRLMQPQQNSSYSGFLNLPQRPQFAYNTNSYDQFNYQPQEANLSASKYQQQQLPQQTNVNNIASNNNSDDDLYDVIDPLHQRSSSRRVDSTSNVKYQQQQQNSSHEDMYININNGSYDPKVIHNDNIDSAQAKQTKNTFDTLNPFNNNEPASLKKKSSEYTNNLEKQLSKQAKEIEKLNKIIDDQKKQVLKLSNENKKLQQHIKEQDFIINYFEEQHKPTNQSQTNNQFEILDSETFQTIKRIDELGRGASSIVYKVSRPVTRDEIYVLKEMTLLNHRYLQNFVKEYEILNMLNHPNVLKTFGIFLSDKNFPASILLEYCTNDISKAIKAKSLSKVDIVLSIYQIAEGMKYIHSKNIIHRDLKPSNIFITDDGTIKIADFGISKIMSADEQQTSMTGNVGTLYFMAPEVMNGEKYDSKADVYSFGVLVFFILNNGVMPKLSLKQIIIGDKIDYPSFFTDFAKKLIDECWNVDPNVRPNFTSVCEEIENNNFHLLDLSFSENQELQLKVRQMKKRITSIYS